MFSLVFVVAVFHSSSSSVSFFSCLIYFSLLFSFCLHLLFSFFFLFPFPFVAFIFYSHSFLSSSISFFSYSFSSSFYLLSPLILLSLSLSIFSLHLLFFLIPFPFLALVSYSHPFPPLSHLSSLTHSPPPLFPNNLTFHLSRVQEDDLPGGDGGVQQGQRPAEGTHQPRPVHRNHRYCGDCQVRCATS